MKLIYKTEAWRELIENWCPGVPEHQLDDVANDACCHVLAALADRGLEVTESHQQSRGWGVLFQFGTHSEEEAFDRAWIAELARINRECAPREEVVAIDSCGSLGIRSEAAKLGITHMRSIGGGYASNREDADHFVSFFALHHPQGWAVRVAATNGDPVWEDEDEELFADLAAQCGVKL